MKTQMNRRNLLTTLAGTSAAFALPNFSWAQGSTTKLTVGFPAGGPADSIARVVASLMTGAGGTVIVDNKPGASGQIAADTVRNATPDGSTLFVTPSSTLSLVPHLYSKPMYKSLEDFVPIAGICDHSFGLAVPGASSIKTLAEFMEAAKSRGADANYATAGAGTAMHFLGTIFSQETGIKLNHVPYRGTAPGLQDLMANQIFSSFQPLPTMLELHRAGKIRILAVTNPKRVASLPDVPTFTELKLPALELVEWYGVFATSKLPADLVKKVSEQILGALNKPELAAAARKLELEPRIVDGRALKEMLETDYKRWAQVVKKTGISLDN